MRTLCGILMVAFVVNARTQERPQAPKSPGFVVLHFAPASSATPASACQPEGKSGGSDRTLLRESRAPNGVQLAVSGQVALRFKASTSARQIDSLIAATGVEVFTAADRASCRRYVLAVARAQEDASVIANKLQASGLVVYAIPDLSAGRSEGITLDSFFVDPRALRALDRNVGAGDPPPSKYAMGQVLSEYTGPLMRIDGGALSAQLAGVSSSSSAVDFVKSHGITTLRLDIPAQTSVPSAPSVRVILYALNGTLVRQLVNETLQSGRYLVGWDGMDDKGRRVQPGVYVAVMTAGSFSETHRLVVR